MPARDQRSWISGRARPPAARSSSTGDRRGGLLTQIGTIRSIPWLVAVLAAPVHLVALVGPVTRGVRAGAGAMAPTSTVVLFHLLFGLVGWGVWRASGGRAQTG